MNAIRRRKPTRVLSDRTGAAVGGRRGVSARHVRDAVSTCPLSALSLKDSSQDERARRQMHAEGAHAIDGTAATLRSSRAIVGLDPPLSWLPWEPELGCYHGNFLFPAIGRISSKEPSLSPLGMRFHSHRLCRIAVFQIRRAMQTIVSLMRTFMLARFARRDAVLLVRVHGAKRCVGLSNQLLKCSNSLKRHCPPSPFRASVTRSHTETNQERPWRRPGGGSFRTQNERGQGPPIVSPGR